MTSRSILFGWGVPKFAQQLPGLSVEDAAAADADNAAIIRLSVRGLLTEAERDRAIRRATRHIQSCLTKIPAPGIEAGTATTEGRGAEHEGPVRAAEAPESIGQVEPPPGQEHEGARVPEGWVLVPISPTIAMQNAGWNEMTRQGFEADEIEIHPIYDAILSAAPRPSSQGGQDNG